MCAPQLAEPLDTNAFDTVRGQELDSCAMPDGGVWVGVVADPDAVGVDDADGDGALVGVDSGDG